MNEQKVFSFKNSEYYFEEDFCISNSNKIVFDFLKNYPNWSSNLINIYGPKYSGKTHLLNIFKKKKNLELIDYKILKKNKNIEDFLNLKFLIVDNLNDEVVDERLIFTLINNFLNTNNYLIIASRTSLIDYKIKLKDLKSRINIFDVKKIDQPGDDLIYALVAKFFSDRQISIDKELTSYIVKIIGRSYENITSFVNNFDNFVLSNKKKISKKSINEFLKKTKTE